VGRLCLLPPLLLLLLLQHICDCMCDALGVHTFSINGS
jgi:hypothetical protein